MHAVVNVPIKGSVLRDFPSLFSRSVVVTPGLRAGLYTAVRESLSCPLQLTFKLLLVRTFVSMDVMNALACPATPPGRR